MDPTVGGKEWAVETRPTFIVGAMRSGTTLMRLILSRHSTLAIPPESHFIAKLFRRFAPGELLEGADLADALEIVTSNTEWQRDWNGDPDALRARVAPAAPLSMGAFIDAVFSLQIEPTGKPHWGDKTPAYLFQVERLRACFPNAKFVAMIRDPRDAYISLAPREWVGSSTWQVGSYLMRCDRLIEGFARDHPDDFCVVRYEDLVADTESTLRRVCGFLSMEYEPAMRDFHVDAVENVQQWELENGVHQKLLRPMESKDVGRWRHEGSRSDAREVEAVTYDAISRFGYETTLRRAAVPLVSARARLRHHLRDPSRSARAVRARLTRSHVPDGA
jgi:hypothetical protein